MKRRPRALAPVIVVGAVLAVAPAVEARPLRIMALDQCADQYVLALTPDADLALSPRADNPDAWMREAAVGRRRVRPTLEAAIGFRPDVMVRYWGGDPRMLSRLEADGVRVLTIADVSDFDGVRSDIRLVAQGLGVRSRGEALIRQMDRTLAEARPPVPGPEPSALYLSAGGFTAGRGTLVDAILQAAGYSNAAARPFYSGVSVERLALSPPARFVLGFFDQRRSDWRGAGRHPVVRDAARGRIAARLPAAALTCPGWFAADAALMLRVGS